MKKISLDSLQELARQLTQKTLEDYAISDEIRSGITLTTLFEGDERVFVLYVPGVTRNDGREIARTRMNIFTGEGTVEIFGLERK